MSAKNTLSAIGLTSILSAQACGPSVNGNSAFDSIRARSAQCDTDSNTVEGVMSEILCEFGKTSEGVDDTSAAACGVADTKKESIQNAQKKLEIMVGGLCPEGQSARFIGTGSSGLATRRATETSSTLSDPTEYTDTGFVSCRYVGFGEGYECKPKK